MLLFSFKPSAPVEARQAMLEDFAAVAAGFRQLKHLELGRNASRRDGAYTHAMTAQFEGFADLEAYLDSPEHERFVTERFRPLISERAIVSMAVCDHQEEAADGGR